MLPALLTLMQLSSNPIPFCPVPAASRTALGVTLYQDGRAMVRDRRRVDLPAGPAQVAFQDVAATMNPRSALVQPLQGAPWRLLEQNHEWHLITPQTLAEQSLGLPVGYLGGHPRLAATQEGSAVVVGPQGAEGVGVESLTYARLPEGLRERPTLLQTLVTTTPGPREMELAYLAEGLAWRVQYLADLAAEGDRLDLRAWITLTNGAGTDFPQATLQFVAGTLNWAKPEAPDTTDGGFYLTDYVEDVSATEEKLQEHLLVTLPRPTTLARNQQKQVAYFEAPNLPVKCRWQVHLPEVSAWAGQDLPPTEGPILHLEVPNAAGGPLGRPLPMGDVLLRMGGLPLATAATDNTPVGEPLALDLNALEGQEGPLQTRALRVTLLGSKGAGDGVPRLRLQNRHGRPVTVRLSLPTYDRVFTSPPGRLVSRNEGYLIVDVDLAPHSERTLTFPNKRR